MSPALLLNLDDVLGNLQHARRTGDLGRLAFVTYWDVRKWARRAGQDALAERAANMITMQPHPSKTAFLESIDEVIFELEHLRGGLHQAQRGHAAGSLGPAPPPAPRPAGRSAPEAASS